MKVNQYNLPAVVLAIMLAVSVSCATTPPPKKVLEEPINDNMGIIIGTALIQWNGYNFRHGETSSDIDLIFLVKSATKTSEDHSIQNQISIKTKSNGLYFIENISLGNHSYCASEARYEGIKFPLKCFISMSLKKENARVVRYPEIKIIVNKDGTFKTQVALDLFKKDRGKAAEMFKARFPNSAWVKLM